MARLNKAKIEMEIEYKGKKRDLENQFWILFKPSHYKCGKLVNNYKIKTIEHESIKIPPKENKRLKRFWFYKKIARKICLDADIDLYPRSEYERRMTNLAKITPLKPPSIPTNFEIVKIDTIFKLSGEYAHNKDYKYDHLFTIGGNVLLYVCDAKSSNMIVFQYFKIQISFSNDRFMIHKYGDIIKDTYHGNLHHPDSIKLGTDFIKGKIWKSKGKFGELLQQYLNKTMSKSPESRDTKADSHQSIFTKAVLIGSTSNPEKSKSSSGKNTVLSMSPDYKPGKAPLSVPDFTINLK